MSALPIAVIADDLTGAAEVAAVGFRFGLRSAVSSDFSVRPENLVCLVLDTDSRLVPSEIASSRVAEAARHLIPFTPELVFKKVDSVLRGNVLAEIGALASALGRSRVLLLPENPSLGRVIRDGHYFIHGVPLHETAFASDPHHPAASSQVRDLLRGSDAMPVSLVRLGDPLPPTGVIVAEAANASEVERWAERIDSSLLAAGGSEFFAALLRSRKFPAAFAAPTHVRERPVLVVSGSLAPASRSFMERADRFGWLRPMPSNLAKRRGADPDHFGWPDEIRATLFRHGVAVISASHLPGNAEQIRDVFASAVQRLRSQNAFGHLVVEGGATSASVLSALKWTSLEIAAEWAPGVISLRPLAEPHLVCTLKPGSYAWPESLLNHLSDPMSSLNASLPKSLPRQLHPAVEETRSRPS